MRLSTPGVTVTVALPTEPGRGAAASGVPVAMAEKSPWGGKGRICTLYTTPGVRFGMV